MAKRKYLKAGGLAALTAAIAVVSLPGEAAAQDGGHWNGRGRGANAGQVQARQQGQAQQRNAQAAQQWLAQHQAQRQVQQQRSAGGAQQWRGQRDAQAQAQGGHWNDRAAAAQQWHERNRTYADPSRNTGYSSRYGGQWSGNRQASVRNWRGDSRYNWSAYRNAHRDVFRAGRYYSPYNDWSYRRIGIGFGLDSLFYSQRYWIDDPWEYRLPEVDGPYRWVRYYDDVLLVDIYNGEVVDAIYDFFW